MLKPKRPNIILDSATLVSAFLTKAGVSAELLRRCEHEARLYTAGDILDETRRVLLEEQMCI
jgi:predicted nucleic acid-binding protein